MPRCCKNIASTRKDRGTLTVWNLFVGGSEYIQMPHISPKFVFRILTLRPQIMNHLFPISIEPELP